MRPAGVGHGAFFVFLGAFANCTKREKHGFFFVGENMAEDGRLQAARRAVQPGNQQVGRRRNCWIAASQAKGRVWGPDGAMVDQPWYSIKDMALWPLGSYLEDDPHNTTVSERLARLPRSGIWTGYATTTLLRCRTRRIEARS